MPRTYYADPDYPWDDEADQAALIDTSGIQHLDLLKAIWSETGGRTKFYSASEKRRWLRVDKGLGSKYPERWIDNCREWARDKNEERIIITFPKILNLIMNKGRMTDWLAENPDAGWASIDDMVLGEDGFSG